MPLTLILSHHGRELLLQLLVQQPHVGASDALELSFGGLRVQGDGLGLDGLVAVEFGPYSLFDHLLMVDVVQDLIPPFTVVYVDLAGCLRAS